MRAFLFGILMLCAPFAHASTLAFSNIQMAKGISIQLDPFQETMDAYQHSYRDAPGPPALPFVRMSLQLPLVIGLGWWLALILPAPRSSKSRRS